MNTKLIWATPDGDKLLAYMARVSNPQNQNNPSVAGLLRYMVRNQHWSPFEMVSACVEIETTRDIARQILRHRSFVFQEFSQRYQDVTALPPAQLREARTQDPKNRQAANPTDDIDLADWWRQAQATVVDTTDRLYKEALDRGIAKEQARALLPEGLTPSRMYMSGTLRSWMHYCQLRGGHGTQSEHQDIANALSAIMAEAFPEAWAAINT